MHCAVDLLAMLAVQPIGCNNLGANLKSLALLRDQMHSLHETVVKAEADALMSSEHGKCDGNLRLAVVVHQAAALC